MKTFINPDKTVTLHLNSAELAVISEALGYRTATKAVREQLEKILEEDGTGNLPDMYAELAEKLAAAVRQLDKTRSDNG